MPDVFQRTIEDGGTQSTDVAVLTFAGASAGGSLTSVGQLVQSLQLQYQQNIQRFYDLSSSKIFYVGGRTQGTANIGFLIGPAQVNIAMYTQLGDVCKAAQNTVAFTLKSGCSTAGVATRPAATYTCGFTVMNSVQLSVQAEQMVIQHQVGMTVGRLEATQS